VYPVLCVPPAVFILFYFNLSLKMEIPPYRTINLNRKTKKDYTTVWWRYLSKDNKSETCLYLNKIWILHVLYRMDMEEINYLYLYLSFQTFNCKPPEFSLGVRRLTWTNPIISYRDCTPSTCFANTYIYCVMRTFLHNEVKTTYSLAPASIRFASIENENRAHSLLLH
jgi:hypothetical protein